MNERIYKNKEYLEKLDEYIKSNKFESKENLLNHLKKIEQNIDINDPEYKKFKLETLSKYDEYNKKEETIVEGLKEVKNEDNNFIHYKDNNNSNVLLENDLAKNNLQEEYKMIQNENIVNGISTDKDTIENQMKNKKIEVKLQEESNIKENELTNDQLNQKNMMDNMQKINNETYLANVEKGIYINDNDINFVKNDVDGTIQVNKAITKEITTTQEEIKGNDYKIDFSALDDYELDFLISGGGITERQKEQASLEKKSREEEAKMSKENDTNNKENNKTLIMTLNKPYNGFASLLVLSLVTGIGGMSIFMYIMMIAG